jgi:hypothetical protein
MNFKTLKNWKLLSCIGIIFAGLQFVTLTIIAMFFYTGGTNVDPNSVGYNFWFNFFSDLGRITAYNGNFNTISQVLFTIALTLVGIFLIPFLITLSTVYIKKSNWQKIISIIASIIGIFSAICFIGIAFTPADLNTGLHGNFVRFAFLSILIVVILYSVLLLKDLDYSNTYAAVFVISSIFLSYLVIIQILNLAYDTPAGLALRVVSQKVVVYFSIVSFSIQGYGFLKFLKSKG